jgi:hypothetical protein
MKLYSALAALGLAPFALGFVPFVQSSDFESNIRLAKKEVIKCMREIP